MKDENEFNDYIDKLKTAYNEKPNEVSKEVRNSLVRLKIIKDDKLLSDVKKKYNIINYWNIINCVYWFI